MKILTVKYKPKSTLIKNSDNRHWTEEIIWLDGTAKFNTLRTLKEVNKIVRANFDEINSRLSTPNAFFGLEKYAHIRKPNKPVVMHLISNKSVIFSHTTCHFSYKDDEAVFYIAKLFDLSVPYEYIEYEHEGKNWIAKTVEEMHLVVSKCR